MSDAGPAPKFDYWHLWTDDAGVSRQTLCTLADFELAPLGPGATPQWNAPVLDNGNAFLSVLPIGWLGPWHENRFPKWIYVLSGRWFVESMDGQRVEIGPGEFSFGADENCKPDSQGHVGHLSGQVGVEPCVQLIVQRNDDAWVGARPGAFK